jgi:hypothetical protein
LPQLDAADRDDIALAEFTLFSHQRPWVSRLASNS